MGRVMDDLFVALGIDKVLVGGSSAASFITSVEECIRERECKLYDEDFNKLALFRKCLSIPRLMWSP